jgi:hypothetical protein
MIVLVVLIFLVCLGFLIAVMLPFVRMVGRATGLGEFWKKGIVFTNDGVESIGFLRVIKISFLEIESVEVVSFFRGFLRATFCHTGIFPPFKGAAKSIIVTPFCDTVVISLKGRRVLTHIYLATNDAAAFAEQLKSRIAEAASRHG